jgi:REP element-mobilizing transposase RayT
MVWSSRQTIEHAGYHTISVTRGRAPVFADQANAQVVVEAIRHATQTQRAYVLAYAVMPDHLHLLVVPRGDVTISSVMQHIKRFSAKRINARSGERGSMWQQSFFDRIIRGDAHLTATIAYIEHNPVSAGLVRDASEYRFSSAWAHGFNDKEAFWNG